MYVYKGKRIAAFSSNCLYFLINESTVIKAKECKEVTCYIFQVKFYE